VIDYRVLERSEDFVILQLRGELAGQLWTDRLKRALEEHYVDDGVRRIRVDVSPVTFLDNFGVATQTLTDVPLAFPTGSWRSIYSGQTATVNEIMVDEIARTLHADPVAFRRKSLASARTRAVLDQVTNVGRWGRSMPVGTAQGVAIHEEYKSVVAYLVEIDCRNRSTPRVTKGVCAVDVGRAVNPRGLEAQVQGVLTDGLSMTLHAGLHIDNGAVREGSYSDYRFARMADSPLEIDVTVMPPTGEPGGAGELGFPAAAAAVANAYARATATTPFSFPISG